MNTKSFLTFLLVVLAIACTRNETGYQGKIQTSVKMLFVEQTVTSSGSFYASEKKYRFEMEAPFGSDRVKTISLIDFEKNNHMTLNPANQTFYVFPGEPLQSVRGFAEWSQNGGKLDVKALEERGWTQKSSEKENLLGHPCRRVELSGKIPDLSEPAILTAWLADDLDGFMLKSIFHTEIFHLEQSVTEIERATIDPKLFDVPSDYRKSEPPNIERRAQELAQKLAAKFKLR